MMTQAKHTPGPWIVPDQTWRRSLTVEVGGKELVQCPGSGGAMSYTETICTLNWNRTPEWDANARLIAAAPDMYEALCKLEYWFDTDQEILDAMSDYDRRDHFEKLKMIRAAIAKAKGEVK